MSCDASVIPFNYSLHEITVTTVIHHKKEHEAFNGHGQGVCLNEKLADYEEKAFDCNGGSKAGDEGIMAPGKNPRKEYALTFSLNEFKT